MARRFWIITLLVSSLIPALARGNDLDDLSLESVAEEKAVIKVTRALLVDAEISPYQYGMELAGQTAPLERLLHPLASSLPLQAARAIVSFRADPQTQARIDELAEKCTEGTLSSAEQHEYEAYVDAIDFIAILQDQARETLENHTET